MTVSQFSEVAHYPTRLWVCVATTCLTHELITESGRFTLCVLHVGQAEIALRCGSVSGRERDKCSELSLYEGEGGLYLDGAMACISCRVSTAHSLLNGHTLFLADILSAMVDTETRVRRHLLTLDLA